MLDLSLIQQICIWVLPLLFAITLHEAAHGFVAYKLGDPTAKLLGRVSMNPTRHIDPIGTVAVPLLIGLMSNFAFVFGWAKPVPISERNFKNPKRDAALVAIAGPMANLLMCIMWAAIMKLSISLGVDKSSATLFLFLSAKAGIFINLILMLLNLLPIPPLDGSRFVSAILPGKWDYYYQKVEPYGFIIIIALLVTNLLGLILTPPFRAMLSLIQWVFQF